jgi:hypothetical protein
MMIIPQLYHKNFLFQFDRGCIMAVGANNFGRKSPLTTHTLPAKMLRYADIFWRKNTKTVGLNQNKKYNK